MRQMFAAAAVLCGILAAATFAAPPAQAQNISANPELARDDRLVKLVTIEDMKALVVTSDAVITAVNTTAAEPYVIGKHGSGLFFVVVGKACNIDGRAGCVGLSLEVRYDADARVTNDKLAQANNTFDAVKVTRGPNQNRKDTVFIANYAILDEGQTMGNLKTILVNVISIGPSIREMLFPGE
jgi:hypothetical protein